MCGLNDLIYQLLDENGFPRYASSLLIGSQQRLIRHVEWLRVRVFLDRLASGNGLEVEELSVRAGSSLISGVCPDLRVKLIVSLARAPSKSHCWSRPSITSHDLPYHMFGLILLGMHTFSHSMSRSCTLLHEENTTRVAANP